METSTVGGVVETPGDMHNSIAVGVERTVGKTDQLDEKLGSGGERGGGERGAICSNNSEVEGYGSSGSEGRLENEKIRSRNSNSSEQSQSSNCRFSQLSTQSSFSDIAKDRSSPSSSELLIDVETSSLDSSDSSWIYSKDTSDDIRSYISDHDLLKKHTHFGKDLSGFSDENNICYGLISDFSEETALKTTSVGTRKAFIVGNNNSLNVVTLRRRFVLDYDGPVTFIESSQLCRFHQCGRGSVVAFRLLSSAHWKLGIVKSIFPLNSPPVVDVFEWTGGVSYPGVPEFVSHEDIDHWLDISSHFTLRELSPDGVELLFLNQVRGIPIGNNPISDKTRNSVDNGIQCSSLGPDIFSPQIPSIVGKQERKHFSFDSITLKEDNMPFCSAFVSNNKFKRRRSQIASKIRVDAPSSVHQWNKRCNFTVRSNILGSFLLVTKKDNSPVSKNDVSVTPPELKGKFIVPDMQSFEDNKSPFQYFSPLSASARMILEKKCRDGVSPSEFDELVSQLSESPRSIVLLSSAKIDSDSKSRDHASSFRQIFAGGGSPVADGTFEKFELPNSQLMIFHKQSTRNEFNSFVPLSTSCFDAKFHGIRIIPQFVEIISKALGKRGIFPSRPCSTHIGHSSYLGQRSTKSASLPSPSEGPSEHGRWYYRQYINQVYWPFVLKLYNRLGQNASRMDFYLYKHLGALFPYANSHDTHIRYSRLLIATINFECTNHCDGVDLVSGGVKDNMLQELDIIKNDKDIRGFSKKIAESSIDFLNCWDISVPTTCCYQIVVNSDLKQLKPETIQFFCLSGLGICYRILDYWSHCFMAASFHHCTSTALYLIGKKVYVGKYSGIDVFAWGKGGTAENANRRNANAARAQNIANAAGGIDAGEEIVDEARNNNGNDGGADGEESFAGGDANENDNENLGNLQGGTQGLLDENYATGSVEGEQDQNEERVENAEDPESDPENDNQSLHHSDEEREEPESVSGNVSESGNDNENANGNEQHQNFDNESDMEQNENDAAQGGSDSDDENGWGSGGEHGDGYGPGRGEGDEESSNNSENSAENRRNGMSVDRAMNILGINPSMEMNEQNLNRIYRRQMLNVHPDRAHIHGLSSEQATFRSQRLNDAVEEMRFHLNLPPGRNIFNPIDIDDSDNEVNNE